MAILLRSGGWSEHPGLREEDLMCHRIESIVLRLGFVTATATGRLRGLAAGASRNPSRRVRRLMTRPSGVLGGILAIPTERSSLSAAGQGTTLIHTVALAHAPVVSHTRYVIGAS
jgi:hypothetical protein